MDTHSPTDHVKEIYLTGLRNQHAVENQAIQLLSRQVERLENYPEAEARMRLHIDETKRQVTRLEEILARYDTSHSTFKDTMMSFVGNMAALTHAAASDEVIKNTFANYAFEHFEIASYVSLLSLNDHLGLSTDTAALKQSLGEEEAMAEWIRGHIAPTTLRYASLSAAGHKAGV